MIFSYNWLKELSGTKKSPEQLAKLLLTHAFEVENIEKFSLGLDGFTIGEVIALDQHPNADKLRVAQVRFSKKDTRQIVCGAPNIARGQKVAVALPGTKLPGGIEIGVATLRGVESNGMVCSASELGLGDDQSGILVLPDDAPVGALFAKHFGLDDSAVEMKILPDRGSDALAYQGVAREIAALDGYAPHFGDKKLKTIRVPSPNRVPKIVISDKEGCLRYVGISFKGIVVTESPLWLKVKLIVSGLRPINNIVDITNYLMLLTGQPMHAFDADVLEGAITIRKAKKNEKLTLLTGEVKRLSSEDVLIADSKKALALAGVMGGKESAVTESTKNIFLEVATFDGSTIRRTKTRHNLATDASYRFERNLDPNLPTEVAKEAVALVMMVAGGKMAGMRDVYPRVAKSWDIPLSLDRVERVLGIKLPLFEVVRYLALLGLQVKKVADEDSLSVTVPTRRPDLRDEWNLIEEVGRMHGYDKVTPLAPILPLVPSKKDVDKHFTREAKKYLANIGFDEIIAYSFYSEKDQAAARLSKEHHLELENPGNPDQALLQTTLLPTLLRKVRENLRHLAQFDCFEWESVFARGTKRGMVTERKMLALGTVLAGKGNQGEAFFTLKGKVTAFLQEFHIEDVSFIPLSSDAALPGVSLFHPTRSAAIVSGGHMLGSIGELHPSVAKSFGLDVRMAFAEFDTQRMREVVSSEIVYTPLQRFPYALRDISLTFPRKVTIGEVEQLLLEVGAPLLRQFELFDIYEQEEEKNLAFHLYFGALDRTITSDEMDAIFDGIVARAGERFEARLRA